MSTIVGHPAGVGESENCLVWGKKTSAHFLTRIESGRGRNGSVFLLSIYLQVLELTPKGMIKKKKKKKKM